MDEDHTNFAKSSAGWVFSGKQTDQPTLSKETPKHLQRFMDHTRYRYTAFPLLVMCRGEHDETSPTRTYTTGERQISKEGHIHPDMRDIIDIGPI